MRDYSEGLSVINQVLVFKKITAVGEALVEDSLTGQQSLLYIDQDGLLKFKNENGVFTLSGESFITVANENERYALNGILPGQQVYQTEAAVVVSGAGTEEANGVYTYRGLFEGIPYFILAGKPDSLLDYGNFAIFYSPGKCSILIFSNRLDI